MDNFNVPKKVNRHVLKALSMLSGGDRKERISTSLIMQQVKYQMRNLVPVPNIDSAIHRSLKNLSDIGLIDRHGVHRFGIGRCSAEAPPPAQGNPCAPDRRVFRGTDPRRCSRSNLDPNLKRNHQLSDEDSLSGDDFVRTRKRMRSNNKTLRHSGRSSFLPGARQHCRRNNNAHATIDTPLFPQDLYTLHHPYVSMQATGDEHNSFDVASSSIKNSTFDFMLGTMTPVPSLEISEITEDVKKIIEVRQIVETPPMQQQDPMVFESEREEKAQSYEEEVDVEVEIKKSGDGEVEVEEQEGAHQEVGVGTENTSNTFMGGTVTSENSTTALPSSQTCTSSLTNRQDSGSYQTETPSCTSRRTEPTASSTVSQKPSKSKLPDHTLSYIK